LRKIASFSPRAASCVTIIPPSPRVPRFFDGKKLKQPTVPIEPAWRPLYFDPMDCAASSMTNRLCFLAMAMIGSMSAICPNRCTGMIALVRGVMAASIFVASMLNVSGSMSTNTGLAHVRAMHPAVAKNVYGVVMTSSPGPIPSVIRAHRRASVPLETPTAAAQPLYLAIASSICFTCGPLMKWAESTTSSTAFMIFALIGAYCALRSSSGTFMVILSS